MKKNMVIKNAAFKKKIPSIGPSITDREIELVTKAITYGWYENMNLYIDQFVKEFSSYVGMKYCLPTSHGTAAIHLALLALDIGSGDEVIVPDITWVGSVAPVDYVGAKIVFCDIDEKNWCLCPKSFKRAITKRTKALIAVDLFGNMPDYDEINKIAREKNIHIVEDAAEAIGAEYKNKKAGTLGKIGMFSFNATKLVMSGQGGMLVTDDRKIYEKAKLLSHHGINKKPNARYYWSNEMGFNYNWTNIQAALALAQLRRIEELLHKKKQIYNWYHNRLKNIDGLSLNIEEKNVKNTFWLVVAILNKSYKLSKERLHTEFKKYNIDARPYFYPISSMPPYTKYCRGKDMKKINPVSYDISPYGICLPSGFDLTKRDVDYVCDTFCKILGM